MRLLLASTAAATLLLGASAVYANEDQGEPILVDATNSAAQWVHNVSGDLDESLSRIDPPLRQAMPEGIVKIRFELDNGQPVNVRLMSSSGQGWLDRAATRSVKRMQNIPDMPLSLAGKTTVQANIISAKNERSLRGLQEDLRASEEARMAQSGPEPTVLALNSLRPSG